MKYRAILLAAAASLLTGVLVAQGQVPGINSTLNTVFTLAYDNSTMKATYSANAFLTPAVSPTDVCSISGSATKNIKVRRVQVGGLNSAIISEAVAIVKRSTAYTAGAGSAMTKVPYDSASVASTVGMAEAWTAAPTAGTLVGVLADVWIVFGNTTTGAGFPYVFEFGQRGSPVVLRGVAQQLAVSLNGQGGGTGTISCTFEWTEDTDT